MSSQYYQDALSEKATDNLAHHGIKGMRWGIRRYQNYDGSLTIAGKQRYNSSTDLATHETREKSKKGFEYAKTGAKVLGKFALGLATGNPAYLVDAGAEAVKSTYGEAASKKKETEANKRRQTEEIDEETGFYKKNNETSIDDDVTQVNPSFKNISKDSKNNCVLCTTAMELRQRGYDVMAKKTDYGYSMNDAATRFFKNAEVSTMNSGLKRKGLMTGADTQSVINSIIKQGNGARGNLMVQWFSGGGHSIYYKVDNGRVIIYDAQTGKKYTNPEKIFKNVRPDSTVTTVRLDKAEIDKKTIKEAAY